jgi:Zn-dependent protease
MNITGIVYSAAVWIIPLTFAIVFHEVAHGWVASALGDPTARSRGRLTLNPISHVDPVGTLVVPLGLALAHLPVFGWAKPVPVDYNRLRNPRLHMMLVALAGPVTNLILATIAALCLALFVKLWAGATPTGVAGFLAENLINFVMINVFLALFNLLPLPPFDGGHVVAGLLPPRLGRHYMALSRYGFLLLIGLLVVLPMIMPGTNVIARLIGPPADAVIGFFFAIAGLRV